MRSHIQGGRGSRRAANHLGNRRQTRVCGADSLRLGGSLALPRNEATRPGLCIRQITSNLETRPREWGDPYTNFRNLNAVGFGRTILPSKIRVQYVVHDTEPLVWITSIRPLMGSPFG